MGRKKEEGCVTWILQGAREGSAKFSTNIIRFRRYIEECEWGDKVCKLLNTLKLLFIWLQCLLNWFKFVNNKFRKKSYAFHKAKQEYRRKVDEKKKRIEEAARIKAEREEALKNYKQKKIRNFKVLSKKTKKGQPVMKGRIEMLLERIQQSVTWL